MKDSSYFQQAQLLLRMLPLIDREKVFALKGGTAINFFWRDIPRLSVDIDLTYIPIKERELSLTEISDRLVSIETRIRRIFSQAKTVQRKPRGASLITGLLVENDNASTKIEANTVIRGSVFPVVKRSLSSKAEEMFELSVEVNTLSLEDLFGGKICAALDRQHPRDLFDIKLLLENEGFTEGIRKAFIVYLISHDRPIVELLDPGLLNIEKTFETEFKAMTRDEVTVSDLIRTRENLIGLIKTSLTEGEKKFLLSFKRIQPEWDLVGIEGIQELPAVQWKLHNLSRMQSEKHNKAYRKLEKYLET
jgi:predicted nucleotidyltransferase component of viral defense system